MTEPLEGASAPGGMLVPPMMGGLGQRSSSGRNRQTALDAAWDLPTGVPSILVPALEAEVHDPGVGVIGIDL
jgi:hypothetical protein